MLAIMTILTIQAVLSAQLLEICLMLFANLSIAFLIDSVIPQPRKVESSLGLILGVLSSLSYFAVAFPCGQIAERPIPPRRCRSSGPLVDSIVLNLTIDLLLVSWLFPTLAEKRLTAMVLFGSRAT
ncbi:hypothetical protein HBH56_128410 [Parastagonospora nodorum]|uniref:Uncharacterized protein n=1 Tax=Phaeosphaeria nodorum (strain SN15 / ATCC MYA-4574 / FGSC 10173) TaxID=321614 RepID=A0A7U2I9E2_PHANO|nr:hypothetical protein HBH56_128410 [Parastagonospora nodorum]QRD05665.1 hypothetical protein JI435_444760 [Parastagonospora nodorum SN15]KAH3931274.1 hypothetical protein HBH54_095070 [Parastagonospora nodorum]KAH4159484.1 hypothetical protein HBH44_104880 [Parastagonospora nodorum]KAH4574077.1 hypothetical protein HBH84_089560 [Parastagonospora nodorum]